MKPFADLPTVEMTVEQIFAANQKANAPIPIRRRNKNSDAARDAATPPATPDASAFAQSVSIAQSVAPAQSNAPIANGAAPRPQLAKTSANLGALPILTRKWGELWWPLALLTLLIVGVGGGWLYMLGRDWADRSIFLTWAAVGIGTGVAFLPAIRLGKNRSVVAAISMAALACTLVYGSTLGWSALQMRGEMIDGFAPIMAKRSSISVGAARQQLERKLTPQRAVTLYLADMNRFGITLLDSDKTRVNGASGGGTHLSGAAFWVYYVFQIGLTALIAGGIVSSLAKSPFHEGSGQWYRKFAAYAVHPSHVAPLLQLCQQGKWSEAGKLAKGSKTNNNIGATATVYFLPAQGGFVRVSSSQKSGSKTLFERELSESEVKMWKPMA